MSERSSNKKKGKRNFITPEISVKSEQERSGSKAATRLLTPHRETYEEDKEGDQLREGTEIATSRQTRAQIEAETEELRGSSTSMEQKLEQLINIVASNSFVIQQLSEQMSSFDDRLRTLEVSSKLSKGLGYTTPRKSKKQKTGVLQRVQDSIRKQDWRTLAQDVSSGEDSEHNSDDEEEDETQTSSEEEEEEEEEDTEDNSIGDNKSLNRKARDSAKKISSKLPSVFKDLDKSRDNAKSTVVTVNRQEKDCTVRIENFTLSHVSRAMMKIMDFQDKEGTAVNMTKVLTNACKEHLKLVYNVTADDLRTMPLSKLFSVLAKQTKIYSKITFYSELKEALSNVKLMEWHLVNTDNHELFYFQQLNLVHKFTIIFRLMLLENGDYCPSCNDKPNGLIYLFKSYHARDYWSHLWAGMSQRYTKLDIFIEEYKEKAHEQYRLSIGLKDIPYSGMHQGEL